MDDIVARLRQEVCECGYSASFNELHKCLRCEAIDEIERLEQLLFQEIYRGQEKVDVIDDLRAELAECQRQYTKLKETPQENKMTYGKTLFLMFVASYALFVYLLSNGEDDQQTDVRWDKTYPLTVRTQILLLSVLMKKTMVWAYPYTVEVTNDKGKVEKVQEYSYEPIDGVKPIRVAYYYDSKTQKIPGKQ